MDVSRSRLMGRLSDMNAMRPRQYRKEQDEELLCLIREILDERKTLGYRRVLIYLNRRLEAEGCARVKTSLSGHARTRSAARQA